MRSIPAAAARRPPTRSSPEWEIGTTRALPLANVWTLTMENAVILQYNLYPK